MKKFTLNIEIAELKIEKLFKGKIHFHGSTDQLSLKGLRNSLDQLKMSLKGLRESPGGFRISLERIRQSLNVLRMILKDLECH